MESTPTADVTLCFHRSLRRSANQMRCLYDQALAPCGLRTHEFGLLACIERSRSVGIAELAAAFLFDRATLRYRLAPLETAGLVAIVPDKRDKRARRIEITQSGSRKLNEATALWQVAQGKFAALLGTDEAEALRAAADRVASPSFADAFLG